jgi:hypothetical protein
VSRCRIPGARRATRCRRPGRARPSAIVGRPPGPPPGAVSAQRASRGAPAAGAAQAGRAGPGSRPLPALASRRRRAHPLSRCRASPCAQAAHLAGPQAAADGQRAQAGAQARARA